jgi:hypothetical protein
MDSGKFAKDLRVFFCSIPDTSTGGFCEEPTITEKIEKD